MFRDAALVMSKDLRLEWRSRVITNQVMPFAALVLVLFAFALDPDRRTLVEATPGLFWLAVLFSALLAIQRAFVLESVDGVRDGLRLSGLDPAGIFLGKAVAPAMFVAFISGAVVGGLVIARMGVKDGRKAGIPFGPWLALGGVVGLLAGDAIVDWYAAAARDLPWRRPGVDAWAVLVSEVMLQQTPVARVEPVWREWMARWPDPASLAAASPAT